MPLFFVMHLPENGHEWPKRVEDLQRVQHTFVHLSLFAGFEKTRKCFS